MGEELSTVVIPITEEYLSAINEEKLPQVFTDQIKLLEKANQEYSKAEEKEKIARSKVGDTLKKADELINAAKKVGGQIAKKNQFLWMEWPSIENEVEALKNNLAEIIKHGGDSAEAQKSLAEVQSALMESQTSVLQVQKAHMEYQRQIASALKFVFGLSAYNCATSQSIVIKLKAILSGASEEQLGELAQQQLFLVLDQIKNQESIITRINENDKLIENLNLEIEKKQKEIDELNEEQNRRISLNAVMLKEHEMALTEQQEKDEEHDKLFVEANKVDKEQDRVLEEHNQEIEQQKKKDEELEERIFLVSQDISKKVEGLDQNLKTISEEFENALRQLKVELESQKEKTNNKIEELESKIRDIDVTTRKKAWKVIITFSIIILLVLNILQILGVL